MILYAKEVGKRMEIYEAKGQNHQELVEEVRAHFSGWDLFIWRKEREDGSVSVFGSPKHQLLDFVQDVLSRICSYIDVHSSVKVKLDSNGRERILAIILTRRPSLFIGWHGRTLDALEVILCAILANRLGTFLEISVDVGQYRMKRENFLKGIVNSIVREIERDHKERPVPNLLPKERRLVHLMLMNHPYLTTESRGEGEDRILYIIPRRDVIGNV